MARWQCGQLPEVLSHDVIDISFFAAFAEQTSALAGSAIEVPALADMDEGELDQPITYVPNRNMMLLSMAAAFAESKGSTQLYYGAQAQDEYGYWDCTEDFVDRINQVLALNRRNAVQVIAPFTKMRKSEELSLGIGLGVDLAHTWTCYRGGEKACGVCPSCIERLKAFEEVGHSDPLSYASMGLED